MPTLNGLCSVCPIEEEVEETETAVVSACCDNFKKWGSNIKERCWPILKKLLTFTISHESRFNSVLGLVSTLLAFISVFTLTFQVSVYGFKTLSCVCMI